MGRLVPIFEDQPGRGKIFDGLFKDEDSGLVGRIVTEGDLVHHIDSMQHTTGVKFVASHEDNVRHGGTE